MTTLRADSRRLLRADERGAILLMGVFMCAALAGLLWYVAGIGDAIVFRERLQEAADAAAFSSAVLAARAMNVLVMINLIMACVLGVRVVLKALQVLLGIASVLCLVVPSLQVLAPACLRGVDLTQRAIERTRPMINNTLKALNEAQGVIVAVAPSAADAGGVLVGQRYAPLVDHVSGGNLPARRLPVVEDEIDTLCAEAGQSIVGLLARAMPPGLRNDDLIELIGERVGGVVAQGGPYFCELGSGTAQPPNVSSELDRATEGKCKKDERDEQARSDDLDRKYRTECAALGAACDGNAGSPKALSAEAERQLSMLRSERDQQQRAAASFDAKKCQKNERDRVQKASGKAQPVRLSSGQGMTPKRVKAEWKNGDPEAQQRAIVLGDAAFLDGAFAGVRVGAGRPALDSDASRGPHLAFAQAEYFFDCKGKWSGSECNGPSGHELALWSFRWRARLRRSDAAFSRLLSSLGHGQVLDALRHTSFAVSGADRFIPAIIRDLAPGALH
jgi:hypothetical protein